MAAQAQGTTTITDLMSLTGELAARPEVTNLISRMFRRSKQHGDISAALLKELNSGVLQAGAAKQVAREAGRHATAMKFFKEQGKAKGIEELAKMAQPYQIGSSLIRAGGTALAQAVETGLFDWSPGEGPAVSGSIRQGLEDTVSPGDLKVPEHMPYLRQQQEAKLQGERSAFGPVDLALDPGPAILGMGAPLGSVQAIDPTAPTGAVSPGLSGYESASPVVPQMMIPKGQVGRFDEATPVTGVRQLPSLAEQQAPRGQGAPVPGLKELMSLEAPPSAKPDVEKGGKFVPGDMTMDAFAEAMRDPERRNNFLRYLMTKGQGGK